MKVTSVTIKVESFRNLETPYQKSGLRNYYAVVNSKDLPDLTEWRRINVRDPKLTGAVPLAIKKGFREKGGLFVFMNRGLVISAASVSFDQKTSTMTLVFTDPDLHGLLDGGHTYNIVKDETKPADAIKASTKTGREKDANGTNGATVDRYLKIEVLEGFSADDITDVVDARNTSNQVADESLMNLQGSFDDLKSALAQAPYFDKIAFKEFEYDAKGDPKPIDVREVIAILTAFDRENFNETVHPINTYRSKAASLKHFKAHRPAYQKLYPLAQQLLQLFDQIQLKLPDLYNKVRGQTGGVSGGKFGKLTGVAYRDGKPVSELYFLGAQSRYGVPYGFVFPILGAFRALLEDRGGQYVWGGGLDPVKLLDGDVGLKLADTIGTFALEAQNPSKTGKSPLVWQACYQSVEVAYLRASK
jgi:hypothetical protein